MGSCAAPSAKGDDKFITTDYLQQCQTMKGVVALGNAGNKTDLLGAKVRELIALACAVTTRCDGCIAFHADAAVKAGATDAEIAEALGVAINLNAGAAVIHSARTLDAVGQARG